MALAFGGRLSGEGEISKGGGEEAMPGRNAGLHSKSCWRGGKKDRAIYKNKLFLGATEG